MRLTKKVAKIFKGPAESGRKRNALVLGGGGARGMAHIGVLKALEANQIPIDLIVGCSFGALIGGVYAQTTDAGALEAQAINFLETEAFRGLGLQQIRQRTQLREDFLNYLTHNLRHWVMLTMSTQRNAILKGERLADCINLFVQDTNFKKNRIPFACNAADLISGQPHLFTEGSMRTAITASASIPGYFPPIKVGNKQLVDGAVTSNLPVRFARMLGAETIIAVDVHPHLQKETSINTVIDIILRTRTITANVMDDELGRGADLLIEPAVKEYFWYEFDRCREMIKAGKEEALRRIAEIRALVHTVD